ncbi:MAG: hypothetical protein E7331_00475 [Clostridiales bacterium]|nr:hypothetical protein [Clostridiales bacterium]
MKRCLSFVLTVLLLLSFCTFASSDDQNGYVISEHRCGREHCYWETPMDITNTEAVWGMLTAPYIMVQGDGREQLYLYSEPDAASTPVGEVTTDTQGVHVLETLDNGWTKVECYSSSFHDSKVGAWNQLVTGYLPTELLVECTPNPSLGLVVDKLNQRLYVFSEGQLLDVLAVSTGLPNEKQPYNETRSGQYRITSKTGGFRSDDLYCALAFRFNSGDLVHEVPYVERDNGKKYYGRTEPKLGTRASHGCIRVQRKRTPSSMNMNWLWKNLKVGNPILIWEDAPGRSIPYPDPETVLYYRAKDSEYYHRSPECFNRYKENFPTDTFLYSQLDEEPFASLTMCNYCYPPLRKGEIDLINQAHLPGASVSTAEGDNQ